MSNQHPYINNGFDLTSFHDSIEQQFHQSVTQYAETESIGAASVAILTSI